MKLKNLAKGLLATTALALAVVVTPASIVKAEEVRGTYTVEKDDCLRKIAKKIYGDEELWKRIYDANSGVVKSNYIIYKGQVLTIPAVSQIPATTPDTTTPAATPEITTPAATPETTAPAATTPETTAPAATTPAATPETTAPTATAPNENQGYVLDYDALASWIYSGFVGTSTSGEVVILATDSESDYGIIIFADDSNMTAASFVGPITYDNEYMTITDETNGLALTCAVSEVGDGTLALDLGEYGVATVDVQVREVMLNFIKLAIEGYTHVA